MCFRFRRSFKTGPFCSNIRKLVFFLAPLLIAVFASACSQSGNNQLEQNPAPVVMQATPEPTIEPTPEPTSEPAPEKIAELDSGEATPSENYDEPQSTEEYIESTQDVQQQEEMVWIAGSGNGTKYHCDSSCSNMSNPVQISLADAQTRGYEACKRCY